MAKEIIDAIRKAETAAAEGLAAAKAEADKLVDDAKSEAKAYYDAELKRLVTQRRRRYRMRRLLPAGRSVKQRQRLRKPKPR